jgi:mannitol/fructose-specific phosphotransferase system IIA component (Ntr-type)
MPVRLTPFLDPARIVLHVQSTRRGDALPEIARLLEGHPDVTDYPGFYRDLLAREHLDPTCLGSGIAVPHARTEHVKAIVLAVGRSDRGIFFENGNQFVRLVFILGTPMDQPDDYLQVVGALCRLLKNEETRTALLRAATPAEFVAAVGAAEEKWLAPV